MALKINPPNLELFQKVLGRGGSIPFRPKSAPIHNKSTATSGEMEEKQAAPLPDRGESDKV
jgi:hypothetical protein